MSTYTPASPGSTAGKLLQKAVSLALVLGVSTFSTPASGGALEPAIWGSVNTFVEQGHVAAADFQTSSAFGSEADPAIGLARASEELSIVKRVLAALKSDLDQRATAYLDRLDEVFDFADDHRDKLDKVAPVIAAHLQSARAHLLESAPTARRWTLLARAVDPRASLRIPSRFIRPPVRHSHGIDIDHLEATVWARSVTSI